MSQIAEKATKLKSLDISLKDFDMLRNLSYLNHLNVTIFSYKHIYSLEPLESLRNLTSLEINFNKYFRSQSTDFSPISKLISLKSVKMPRLKNYSFLQPLNSLEEIDMSYGEIM